MLPLFAAFNDVKTELYRRGNTVIPTPKGQRYGPALAARLKHDVVTGNLPQVSWVLASGDDCEHPNAMPASGARFVASVLDALTADPKVWAKTVVFYTFDENGGFFDQSSRRRRRPAPRTSSSPTAPSCGRTRCRHLGSTARSGSASACR